MAQTSLFIKRIHIEGFKKFVNFTLDFNPDKTIIVGDNESGKTTILEAIDLVLNHSPKNFDLSLLPLFFNARNVEKFKELKNYDSLPRILIQIFIGGIDDTNPSPKFSTFYGNNYEKSLSKNDYGIQFIAKLDRPRINIDTLQQQINNGDIPYEYYLLETQTFANQPYYPFSSAFSFCLVNSTSNGSPSLSNYSRMLFREALPQEKQIAAKNVFSKEISNAMQKAFNNFPDGTPYFSSDLSRSSLENLITIYDKDLNLPLSSKGQGEEAIIKTQMSIHMKENAPVIAIEEPENHLSHSSVEKMISLIEDQQNSKQIIITSHSSHIASGIGLDRVVILSCKEEKAASLNELQKDTSDYFKRVSTDSLLYFVLSKKVILVEGPSELLYLDVFFKKMYPGKSMKDFGISPIAVNGLAFKHFVRIGGLMKKKISIITDNDGNENKHNNLLLELREAYGNDCQDRLKLCMEPDVRKNTFEVCLYDQNKDLFQENISLQENAEYKNDYSNGDRYLGYLLNNKVESALKLTSLDAFCSNVNVPNYIKDSLAFLKDD
jgi:putative ATP-dependent endonuclease of OLD family